MQPIQKTKIFAGIGATVSLALSTGISAQTASYDVGFSTVPDISLIQIQALDFGAGLGLTNGAGCSLTFSNAAGAADDGYPGDTVINIASGNANPETDGTAADILDNVSVGTCAAAVGTKGAFGIYEITGVAGGEVKVTINDVTAGTDFNYASAGCIGDYEGGTAADVCTAIAASGTSQTVTLATNGDTVGNPPGSGIPAVGVARIILAGSITAQTTHTAGQQLSESFTIDVTY